MNWRVSLSVPGSFSGRKGCQLQCDLHTMAEYSAESVRWGLSPLCCYWLELHPDDLQRLLLSPLAPPRFTAAGGPPLLCGRAKGFLTLWLWGVISISIRSASPQEQLLSGNVTLARLHEHDVQYTISLAQKTKVIGYVVEAVIRIVISPIAEWFRSKILWGIYPVRGL